MKVGVIGVGVVGGAVAEALAPHHDVALYDPHKGLADWAPVLACEVVFLALPTLTRADGQQNQEAIYETCDRLARDSYRGVVVVKSTVLPGTSARLAHKYGLTVVHNPEFLTAAHPLQDLLSEKFWLLSGPEAAVAKVVEALRPVNPTARVFAHGDRQVTELAKYFHNCFLSAKVSFCNEMSELCETLGVDYDEMKEYALEAGGIGAGHTAVPGPDGLPGFGGMCFPKDTSALLTFSHELGLDPDVLRATVRGNKRRRL